MPKVDSIPESLKPFSFHGLDLTWRDGGTHATADCPFCSREGKFSIKIESGEWRCFGCNEGDEKGNAVKGGNAVIFIRKLWELSTTLQHEYEHLRAHRSLLSAQTLIDWGVRRSMTTRNWLVPGYNVSGSLCQLYKYIETPKRWQLLPTSGMGHQLFGMNLWDANKQSVYLTEGPWDAMALWERLRSVKIDGESYRPTSNIDVSMYADANVLAVPGATTFFEAWLPLFAGKSVVLMFDSDHPREHPVTKSVAPPAGYLGMQRAAKVLSESEYRPISIEYIEWGPDGYDLQLPSGYDVRDLLTGK